MLTIHTYKTYKNLHRKTYIQYIQKDQFLYVLLCGLGLLAVSTAFLYLLRCRSLAMQVSCMTVLRCTLVSCGTSMTCQETPPLCHNRGGCIVCMSCDVFSFTDASTIVRLSNVDFSLNTDHVTLSFRI